MSKDVDYNYRENTQKIKKSFGTMIEKMNAYQKFKIVCIENNLKISEGLEIAINLFIETNAENY